MHPLLRETRLLSFVGPRGADRESRRGCTSTEGPAEWITLRPEATGGWSAVCDHWLCCCPIHFSGWTRLCGGHRLSAITAKFA
jgi:hypothetical protein